MADDFHIPVMVDAVLQYLQLRPNGIYVDATLGGGGHTEQILKNLSPQGKLIGFDMDLDAIKYSKQRLHEFGKQVTFINDNFANLHECISKYGIDRIDGLVLDLGVSSYQLNKGERGFSFRSNHRIDMRMNRNQSLDGWIVVNEYDKERLANILWKYGEERNARRITNRIVARRPINTTYELSQVVESVVGSRMIIKSLARVFQAIRIEVNNELENLRKCLNDGIKLLKEKGRIVVVSYHSLEDRIVKHCYREFSQTSILSRNKLIAPQSKKPLLRVLTPKPVVASAHEIHKNPQARAAKLRAGERV